MSAQHDEWRNLGKPGRNITATDHSTKAILDRLATPRSRRVVEAHAGVASVNTDGGAKPRQHDCAGDCAASNADTNAALAQSGGAAPRTQPSPGQMVAAGLTGRQFAGLPSPTEG